jgi:C4-dicarboxylate transporter/malic acid transport protein
MGLAIAMADPLSLFPQPLSQIASPREIVRQFTPNWFTATMGTGILALALNYFSDQIPSLHLVGQVLWFFNIGLFLMCSGLYAARWIFFFDGACRIFGHSVVSMFFGAIPMGLATIINGFFVFGLPLWGPVAVEIAHVLWWIDVVMSVACGIIIPYLMFTRQEHTIEKMTAVWLLPVVAAEVAAASGAQLIPHLADPTVALQVMIVCYGLWAFSVPLALSILVVLLLRLVLHKLPPRDMAASSWLALGPIGTGALGLLLLGRDAPAVFAAVGMPDVGITARGLGVIGGAILWGYGVWWFLLAMAVTLRYLREGMPFNIGWWGFTFPLGVFSLATLNLAAQTHLDFLWVFGAILVGMLAIFWSIVSVLTALGAWTGKLFFSPCLMSGMAPITPEPAPLPAAAPR